MTRKSVEQLGLELHDMTDRLEMANEYADGLEARIAELEQKLAQTWQPVGDGRRQAYDTSSGWIGAGASADGRVLAVYDSKTEEIIECELPPNIRLCRKVSRD